MQKHQPVTIVLAEDDDGHAHLIQRNIERMGFAFRIVRVRDGLEALDLINSRTHDHGSESAADELRPDDRLLLILDVKMPRTDGIEVLRKLKGNPRTSRIPVIILTTTDDPREIDRCYALGCNVYVTKPVAYDEFVETIHRIGKFLEIVQYPGEMRT